MINDAPTVDIDAITDSHEKIGYEKGYRDGYAEALEVTVDAVEVVRCDDCIYRDGNTPGQPNILCWQMHSDDYCSYGTKREVGTYCENIVSVVRCKDCRYFNKYGFKLEYTECTHFDCDVTEEGYCSWAERREDGHTER